MHARKMKHDFAIYILGLLIFEFLNINKKGWCFLTDDRHPLNYLLLHKNFPKKIWIISLYITNTIVFDYSV